MPEMKKPVEIITAITVSRGSPEKGGQLRGHNHKEEGQQKSESGVDPEEIARLALGETGLLNGGIRQAKVIGERKEAAHRRNHGHQPVIGRVEKAGEDDRSSRVTDGVYYPGRQDGPSSVKGLCF
jgi:hypothetical protein